MATVKLLEEIIVSRPPGTAVPTTLTLTHFDVYWLNLVPVQRLFFYAVPDLTTAHFTSSIIPLLTSSLSLTLQHFFPLSARLIISSQHLPYIRCTDADTVSVAVCETHMDFNHLTGNGPRSWEQVQGLVPQLPEEKPAALLAVQVTVFPNSGFSIGLTYSHVAADGKAAVHFIKSWASISKSGAGDTNCINDRLPFHNRNLISDPCNKLATINMQDVNFSSLRPALETIPAEKFRYTFVIGSSIVKELKTWVTRKSVQDPPPPRRVSTFMVTCAIIWVCLLEAEEEQQTDDETLCHFFFQADLRERLNLPGNYFGNCLRSCKAVGKRTELVGEDGVYEAAKAIGRKIKEAEKEGMKGVEEWRKSALQIFASGEQVITVAGYLRFKVYETDFGWGRPKKAEHAHIGSLGSIAIAESRSEVGAVEFGLALTAPQFDRFNRAFQVRSSCLLNY